METQRYMDGHIKNEINIQRAGRRRTRRRRRACGQTSGRTDGHAWVSSLGSRPFVRILGLH